MNDYITEDFDNFIVETDYNDTYESTLIENLMSLIFFNVLAEWNAIKSNGEIMNCLDMNKNSLCSKLKQSNPDMIDEYVQSQILSLLLTIIIINSNVLNTHIKN